MTASPIASMTSDALDIAEADAAELRVTIEHLHGRLAIARAEAESHLERIDAVERDAAVKASQRDTFERALAHEREAGRGLVAQVEALRAERVRLATMKDSLCPVTLPSPDRAEELIRSILSERRALMRGLGATLDDKLSDAWAAEWIDATRAALAKLSPAPAPSLDAAFLRRTLSATKHGPGGKGGPGPCDAACVKCEAELMAKAAPAREVAPTRVLVHADGGACHGSRVVDGRCVGCGIAPDMQSTSMWLDADARPVQCEPAKVVAPTLVAVSDEELAVAFYSEPERPALRECIDAADLAGIRAVRAKLGAAEVTEERLAAALCEHFKYEGYCDWSVDARAILAHLRATATKGG